MSRHRDAEWERYVYLFGYHVKIWLLAESSFDVDNEFTI